MVTSRVNQDTMLKGTEAVS
jgi:hypothetical protein